ncbi:MAG: hypothetical protein QOG51_1656 [Verrucomicrobiota bacterium]
MKPARELLKSGRVSEAKYEPPLLSGYVREGAKNYRSGLRIKSAIDVENLCSCWESRSAGKIGAHSVAVGLGIRLRRPLGEADRRQSVNLDIGQ